MLQRVLDNGLTVIVKEDRKAPVAISNVWVAVGSNHESTRVLGWAHGIEHLMFKGTARRGPGDISREVKQAGGELNAGTGHETTNYYIVVPSRSIGTALDIHADVFQHAVFDPVELDKEREVIIEENRMRLDRHTGGGHTYERLLELVFQEAPYRRAIIGTEESLRTTPRDEILRFRDRWYVPSNCAVVVAGDVDSEATFRRIEGLYGSWRGAARPERPVLTEPPQHGFRYRSGSGDVSRVYLKMGWPARGELHPDTFALKVLQQVLGRGRSSRLFQQVREKRGLVSEIAMFEETGRDLGIFVIDAVTDAGTLEDAQKAILAEIERVRDGDLSSAELERAMTAIERDYVSAMETVEGQAQHLGYYWVLGDTEVAERYVGLIRQVGRDQVVSAAGTYLGLEQCSMSVFHPRSDESRISRDGGRVRERLLAAMPARPSMAAQPGITGQPGSTARPPTISHPERTSAPRPVATPSASPSPVIRETLANGLTLVMRRLEGAPLVAIGAFVRSGTAYESAVTNGVTALAQRVMLKGTSTRNAEAIATQVESLGGTFGPSYGTDAAGSFMTVLRRNLAGAWDLLTDVLTNAAFPAEEIERERRLVLEEIASLTDSTLRNTVIEFTGTVFESHPYGLPTLGRRESVAAIGRDDLVGWYRRFYVPANLVITVVGDIDPAEVRMMVSRLEGLPVGERPGPNTPPPLRLGARRAKIITKQVNQDVILVGFPGPSALSDDRYAMEVLQGVLSGMGNRLFVELRDRMSLCYFTGLMYRPMRDAGLIAAYIGTSPDKEREATAAMLGQLSSALSEPGTAEELERAANSIVGSVALDQQTAASLASLYAGCELLGLGTDWPERYPGRILAVTHDDLLGVARRYLDLENYALVMTRPATEPLGASPA